MHKARNGFALIVVLAGLIVLAALFSVVQLRNLSVVTRLSTDRTLLAREAEGVALLRLASATLVRDPAVTQVDLPAPWTGRLVLQNTAGLVDLNTALPDLLDAFARGLALPPDAVMRLRDWRRGGLRLQSTTDFVRLTGLSAQRADDLPALATVFSGRPDLDTGHAPAALLALLGPLSDAQDATASATSFTVWLHSPGSAAPRFLGTLGSVLGSNPVVLERN